ncbi:MAG: acyl-CoA thioesterase [Bacteroidales bacterium]|nr:acyl-CoA thioesterase [Bacteroidales bacterium]
MSDRIKIQDYTFKSKLPIQIRMTDIDAFNHVNNGVLSAYFDLGRLHYLKEITGKLNLQTLDLVLVHTEYDFFASVRFYSNVMVETKVVELGNKSLKMVQQIVDEQDESKCYCTCYSVLSGYDNQHDCSQTIDDQIKDKIRIFEGL